MIARVYFQLLATSLIWFLATSAEGLLAQPVGNYYIYEGASRGLIKGIASDTIGYIWIITDEGVFRFDGERSEFYKDEVEGGFAKNILRRKNGSLLVAADLGITQIIPKVETPSFSKILRGEIIPSPGRLYFPKELFEDSKGKLWIGEDNSVSRYAGGKLKKFQFERPTGITNIFRNFSFQEDGNGTLWAISYSGELFFHDPRRDTFIYNPLPCSLREVTCLLRTGKNTLLAGAGNGVFELVVSPGKEVKSCRQLSAPDRISCGLVFGSEVFLGTLNKGLYRLSPVSGSFRVRKVEFLPFSDIVDLHIDQWNGLWAVNSEAVASFTPQFFRRVGLSSSDVPVSAITLPGGGPPIVASGATVDCIVRNGEEWKVLPLKTPDGQTKTALLGTERGLWIGSISGEIFFQDLNTQDIRKIDQIQPNSKVLQLTEDRSGNVWAVGNLKQGLIRIDSGFFPHFYPDEQLAQAQSLYVSENGQLFCGGRHPDHYLFYYHQEKDAFVDISKPLPFQATRNFVVYQILKDKAGDLLLATSDGLLKYRFSPSGNNEESVSRIDLRKVPPDEPVVALALSNEGVLWVSTTSGLLSYDGKNAFLYDRSSGLPGNTLTQRGLLFDRDNHLWVGASRGVAVFQRQVSQIASTPPPSIVGLKVNGLAAPFVAGKALSLPYRTNLEIAFFSPAFPSEDIQYQTRVLGKEEAAWSEPVADRTLLLSDLKTGQYRIQIRAQHEGGFRWSDPAELQVEVRSPWFLTLWGLLLIGCLLAALIALAGRLYSRRLVQQKKKLEEVVRARTEEIIQQNQKLIEQKNKIIEQQENYQRLQESRLKEKIEHKNKQLTTYTLHLIQKNESLRELETALYNLMRQLGGKNRTELKHMISLIDFSFRNDEEWERFKLYFESVHTGFFENLIREHPDLTAQELRLCALTRLNMSIPEIAGILGISPESVKTSRFRLRKKLNRETLPEMIDFLMSI